MEAGIVTEAKDFYTGIVGCWSKGLPKVEGLQAYRISFLANSKWHRGVRYGRSMEACFAAAKEAYTRECRDARAFSIESTQED